MGLTGCPPTSLWLKALDQLLDNKQGKLPQGTTTRLEKGKQGRSLDLIPTLVLTTALTTLVASSNINANYTHIMFIHYALIMQAWMQYFPIRLFTCSTNRFVLYPGHWLLTERLTIFPRFAVASLGMDNLG